MKMYKLFVLVLLFSIVIQGNSQCTNDFMFSTQTDIDNFLIDNPSCTFIDGNVRIESYNANDPITNLDALQNITSITGHLEIYAEDVFGNPSAVNVSFTGLSSLTSIGDYLLINDTPYNPHFSSLAGFENLVEVNAWHLDNCVNVTSINVFDNLSSASTISINDCPNLQCNNIFPNIQTLDNELSIHSSETMANVNAFSGFNALTHVGNLNITQNYSYELQGDIDAFHNLISANNIEIDFILLNSFSGFENLQHVSYIWIDVAVQSIFDFPALQDADGISLWIAEIYPSTPNCPQFDSLVSVTNNLFMGQVYGNVNLPSLQTVGNDLTIQGYALAPAVTDVNMQALQSVGGDFYLFGTLINDLSGMANLTSVGGTLNISYNTNLTECAIQVICEELSVSPELVFIDGNGPGCNNNAEVASACASSSASGIVYSDMDCDGSFNNADFLLPNAIIHDQNGMPVGSTYADGSWLYMLDDNTSYTLSASSPGGFSSPADFIFNTNTSDIVYANNFALCPVADYHDVSVQLFALHPIRGWSQNLFINITNHSTFSDDILVTLDLTNTPGLNVANAFGGIQSGNLITWDLSSPASFDDTTLVVTYIVDIATPIGTIYHPVASIGFLPVTTIDDFLLDNVSTKTLVVSGSYDPNGKEVSREAINVTEFVNGSGVSLEYFIHFQNTGTSEAETVRITDDLPANLDITSFEMIGASHNYALSFDESNRIEWIFDAIHLPDSASDPIGSIGYIQFRINTTANLEVNDQIENNAAIYFDFNAAVVTDYATTVIYECLDAPIITGVTELCAGENINLIATDGWSNYTWILNDQSTDVGNNFTYNEAPAGSYHFEVQSTTLYCDASATLDVNVHALPATPVISQSGNVLTATGTGNFSWMLDGASIGTNSSTLTITESGNYSVTVEEEGCASNLAGDQFEYTYIDEHIINTFITISPNPMSSSSLITMNGNPGDYEMEIFDLTGRKIVQKKFSSTTLRIQHSDLGTGIYFVRILRNGNDFGSLKKLVVE